ncbi:23S rRNA (guanosine(2251)-2'-O)-methyltransferase RlmB [Veillonella montpellierensis]|uniref:23S rRNA (guanosine(2251)-2'-O)-methyltransferase RlmB n=1 Tax=Veillonella montpellierensis TaxID=187328 RepID=UPI0023F9078E|nr:23S rRNA (guanosine(2251)-2'-O)-methyltransferase RlmB [Veillonella montpellierensis]
MDNYIVGKNAIREALRANRSIQRILIDDSKDSSAFRDIISLAREQGVEIRIVKAKHLQRYADTIPHQGIVALVSSIKFQDLGDILQRFPKSTAPLLILTDGIEDPHNMGAIIRTAECVGATAVLIPKRHNAPINATVAKTSAGAIESIPLIQVGNVVQTITMLKKQGFWVMGAHMDGDKTLYEADMTVPTVLVIGNEGKGISRLVKESCDFLIRIPMNGVINSLNASVAAAILMYEALRQRLV